MKLGRGVKDVRAVSNFNLTCDYLQEIHLYWNVFCPLLSLQLHCISQRGHNTFTSKQHILSHFLCQKSHKHTHTHTLTLFQSLLYHIQMGSGA